MIEQAAIARRSSRADVADEAIDVIAQGFREPDQVFRRTEHFASSDAGRFACQGDARSRADARKPQFRRAGREKGERDSSLRLDGGGNSLAKPVSNAGTGNFLKILGQNRLSEA